MPQLCAPRRLNSGGVGRNDRGGAPQASAAEAPGASPPGSALRCPATRPGNSQVTVSRPGEADTDRHGEADTGRPGETEAERDDRNLIELLQELRVAGLGVQVLFGFLLAIPFSTKFVDLNQAQRGLYVASLLLAATSTALLLAPVAYHRLVFRQRRKEQLVKDTNVLAILGLAVVGLAISASVLLVVSYVEPGLIVTIITICTVSLFAVLWFVLPLVRRRTRFPP